MNKAVFLDRDGTLNPDPGYISNPNDFNLFPGVAKELKRLKDAGFKLILITNQSGIARGLITLNQLEAVHNKLQNLLKKENAELDAIYFCPHHKDFAVEGEPINCNCRKPEPGMLLKAIKEHNVSKDKSFMIGDRISDAKAAVNAGVKPLLITNETFNDIKTFKNLNEAVNWILKQQ